MKSHHLLIVLLLVSNITLSSGIPNVFVAAASAVYKYFERDGLLPFDSKQTVTYTCHYMTDRLERFDLKTSKLDLLKKKRHLHLGYPWGLAEDLRENFFGQHIASNVILRAVSTFMTDSKPNKPLVLSLHGTSGTGKNHVAKIIARNVYTKGEDSKHVHTYIAMHHFPHKQKSDSYSAQLKQWIHKSVSRFPRSMFIFDEMDKMHPQLIDAIKPFLDYNAHVDGVSYRKAIFLFLSNSGGNVIAEVALDFWRRGKLREELWMNSKELEIQISQNIFNDENSGFLHSSIIDEHLIDHYVPFLPLMLKHVRQCVVVEMIHLNVTQDYDLADEVAREMPYYPEEENIFAVKGCKSVRQKLALHIDS